EAHDLLGARDRPLRESSHRVEVGRVVARVAPSALRHDDRRDARDPHALHDLLYSLLRRGVLGAAAARGAPERRRSRGARRFRRGGWQGRAQGRGRTMTYAVAAYVLAAMIWVL